MRTLLSFVVVAGVGLGATLSVVELLNMRSGRSVKGATAATASSAETLGSLESAGAARDVTPNGALPGPAVTGSLTRREGVLPQGSAQPAEPLRFHQPLVIDAGQLKSGKTAILLDGVVAPRSDETCDDGAGGKWPCGQQAASALRLYVRGRALECDPLGEPDRKAKKPVKRVPDTSYTGRCRVGGVDLASWLVKNGWAKPKGETYAKDLEAARLARTGLWGKGVTASAQ